MTPRWLLRMKRLAQNPPSEGRVKLFLGVIVICIIVVVIERYVGWPDLLTAEPMRRWKP